MMINDDNQRLRIENDQLRKDFEFEIRERNAAICERNAAIRERDEARREVCYCQHDSAQFAINRGWDCFKEETQ